MITLTRQINGDATALLYRLREFPGHIAKKHIGAALRRAAKPGVPLLRKNTPPLGVTKGRKRAGVKRSTGALRRSVTVRVKRTKSAAVAILGYKAGFQSRKAIWLEYGTIRITPRRMVGNTYESIKRTVFGSLTNELKQALEKAAKELAANRNPGRPNV